MKISDIINQQARWEYDRRIKNGNWGADRIQVELDEAKEEPDLYKKLVEYADVFIITMGSVGGLITALNMTAEDFETVVKGKLALNELKYPLSVFESLPTNEAVALCRALWASKSSLHPDGDMVE